MDGLHDLQRGIITEIQPFVTAQSNGVRTATGGFEREKLDLYQRRYSEYVRTGKALQALIS